MADAHARRDERKVVERLLRPPQKRVALAIALDLLFDVARVGVAESERVDLDRVVDDQVDGDERVDLPRVLARPLHRGPHRGQVDHRRHAREVLHQDARGQERKLAAGRLDGPLRQRADAGFFGDTRLGEPDEPLEEDLHGHRQAGRVVESSFGKCAEGVELEPGSTQPRALNHRRQRYALLGFVLERLPNSSLTGIEARTRFR